MLGVSEQGSEDDLPSTLEEAAEQPLHTLLESYKNLNARNLLESFHDAQQARVDMTMSLFGSGYVSLEQRGTEERLFWAICHKARRLVDELEYTPEELSADHRRRNRLNA